MLIISCSPFQQISNATEAIFRSKTGSEANNYLDDFLFITLLRLICNNYLEIFKQICEQIKFPLSLDKTETATQIIIFLGMLLNTVDQTISIPEAKRSKAVQMLRKVIDSEKVTVLTLQQLTGLLNFISRAIVPGRAFTRRM